jgi:hypothetical protein
VCNRACADITVENALVEHVQLNDGRETELSRLQNDIAVVQLIHQVFLRPVRTELDPTPRLVRDVIKVA